MSSAGSPKSPRDETAATQPGTRRASPHPPFRRTLRALQVLCSFGPSPPSSPKPSRRRVSSAAPPSISGVPSPQLLQRLRGPRQPGMGQHRERAQGRPSRRHRPGISWERRCSCHLGGAGRRGVRGDGDTGVQHSLKDDRPEFAVLDRSNVGKSSLINALTRRKEAALTSKKPGNPI
jgi:hypothetical protein